MLSTRCSVSNHEIGHHGITHTTKATLQGRSPVSPSLQLQPISFWHPPTTAHSFASMAFNSPLNESPTQPKRPLCHSKLDLSALETLPLFLCLSLWRWHDFFAMKNVMTTMASMMMMMDALLVVMLRWIYLHWRTFNLPSKLQFYLSLTNLFCCSSFCCSPCLLDQKLRTTL